MEVTVKETCWLNIVLLSQDYLIISGPGPCLQWFDKVGEQRITRMVPPGEEWCGHLHDQEACHLESKCCWCFSSSVIRNKCGARSHALLREQRDEKQRRDKAAEDQEFRETPALHFVCSAEDCPGERSSQHCDPRIVLLLGKGYFYRSPQAWKVKMNDGK